jgi:hypothetical protein
MMQQRDGSAPVEPVGRYQDDPGTVLVLVLVQHDGVEEVDDTKMILQVLSCITRRLRPLPR